MSNKVELCSWESALASGCYDFVLNINERDLEKLELALINSGGQAIEQGLFSVRLAYAEDV